VLPNLFGEWCLLRRWGRIGRGGQLRVDWFRTQEEAVNALRALATLKRRRGYQEKDKAASDLMIRVPKAAGCSNVGTTPRKQHTRGTMT
jgi:predicted DNA-binding WGR domain protein